MEQADFKDAVPSLIGRQLGSCLVVSLLGAGGMGEVYRARDTKLNREVALKILPDAFARDADRLARFRREAQAVAALNHPHIVTIFSIEEQDDVPFMTMELVDGCTLDAAVPGGGLPVARFFDIAVALPDALSAAHRKHIIHRDLKPANVMVTDNGTVKVLDFGLARAVDADPFRVADDVTALGLTTPGIIVGTMPYMSPEQIEARPLDHRTDLFSLGVVLYELAAGERPFRGDSSPALMSAILKDHPKPVGEFRPDVPGDVCRLIDRCLEKDPRDRIQTAAEIVVELKAFRRAWESQAARPATPALPDRALRTAEPGASIAVLAFTDMSAAKDQDWFCDGIAEEILNALAPLKGLRVAARTSAFSFKGKADDLRTIGAKLNVTTVLEGSVRRAGDRVRITVQLSDVANGFQLWSERYDRELKDIFDVQDEIARAIVEINSFVARWALGIALGTAARFGEAASMLDAAAEMSGRHPLAVTGLAGVFGQGGKPTEALVLHRELMDRAARGYVSASHLALTADAAGHREEAIVFARRAWAEREPSFILWARHFPQYRALHSDPRFAAILREMDSSI